MGTNIFRPGAPVTGGNVTIDNRVEYIKLATAQLPGTPSNLLGKFYKVASPNPQIIVKIKEVIPAEGADPETLIVEYMDTTAGTASATGSIRVGNGHVLQKIVGANDSTVDTSNPTAFPDMTTAASGATGRGTKAYITEGSFLHKVTLYFVKLSLVLYLNINQIQMKMLVFKLQKTL